MTGEPTIEQLAETVAHLQAKVETLQADRDRLEETVSEQADRIETLESTVDAQADRINELEATVQDQQATIAEHTERLDTLETTVTHRHEKHLSFLDEVVIGNDGYLTDDTEAFIEEHDSILEYCHAHDAQSTDGPQQATADLTERVSHETAKLRRKLHSVADAAGISDQEVTDAATHEDKLNRLLKYGPSDIVDKVYAVHNRARDLFEHAGEWGRTTSDSLGTRITLTASAVKERLGLKRGESLTSTAVRRVFEKLEALARDSPRNVSADTGGTGENRLVIYLTDAEVNRLT